MYIWIGAFDDRITLALMAEDTKSFSKPPLKRGLKKPPGASEAPEPVDEQPQGSQMSIGSFSPLDAKQAFNTPPSKILEHLYLGSQYNAASKKQLGSLEVKRVLDLKERHVTTDDPDLNVRAVPMSDHGDTTIVEILPECFKFIEDAKSNEEIILVHCRGGVNRSATIVLAYLMKYNGMTLREAWEYVRNRRPSVQPVANYMSQLREYEKSLYGSISLEEQDVARPMSLTQRIGAWREQNRKNGSMPADLSSSRSPRDNESPQDALPTRANTSPLTKRLKRPPPSNVQSKTSESECSTSETSDEE